MRTQPKAFSYIRFSTPEQEKGDSIRRQTEYSEKVATKLGLVLDDQLKLTDKGLSAYNSDHRTKGTLGQFLKLVDKGEITPGSVLIIEALDRLSREGMLEAIHLLTGILLKGIDLYTAMDNKHFQKSTYNLADLIISATTLQQGHEESEKKSQRIQEAWKNKRNLAIHGERKLTARCPAWLLLSDDKKTFTVRPEVVEVVKQIFEMKLNGRGTGSIEKELNQQEIWKPKNGWYKSYVDKILRSPAVYGEFQPHFMVQGKRQQQGEPIENYYPPIIPKEVFDRVQHIIKQNREGRGNNGGRNGAVSNLFGHLAICSKCGGPMAFINKGHTSKGGQYLICDRARRGLQCIKTKIRYDAFEPLILSYCKGLQVSEIMAGNGERQSELKKLNNQLQAQEGELSQVQRKIDNTLDSISTTDNKTVRKSLEEKAGGLLDAKTSIEIQLKETQTKIDKLSSSTEDTEKRLKSIKELIERMPSMEDTERRKLRLSLRNELRRLIDKIRVFVYEEKVAIFFSTGERRLLSIREGRVLMDARPKGRN